MGKRVCSVVGCPNLTGQPGRCPSCTTQASRLRDSAPERGYTSRAPHRRFREAVLLRDPVCVCTSNCDWHIGTSECLSISSVADHAPHERWELIASGLDPNNPAYGQGLCVRCHNRKTATTVGGWGNAS